MDRKFEELCHQAVVGERRIAQSVSRALSAAIKSDERDIKTLDQVMEPLWDTLLGLSAAGTRTYLRYVRYIETFDPEAARERMDDFEDTLGYKLLAVYVAAELAQQWHTGQQDRAGKDSFEGHLTTVSSHCFSWKAKIVGLLHDTAEDTPHTVEEIIATLKQRLTAIAKQPKAQEALIERYLPIIDSLPNERFHPLTEREYAEIAEALSLLNKNTAPSREAYIQRFRGHALAIKVKVSDMRHNMDLSRLPHPTPKDLARNTRYQREYAQLLEMLNELYPIEK